MPNAPEPIDPAAPDLPPRTREALGWITRLTSGEATEADATALKDWRAADPRHDRAFVEAARLWQRLGPAANLSPAVLKTAPNLGRRRLMQWGMMAAGTAGLLVLTDGYDGIIPDLAILTADHRTGIGERRSLSLSDGSRVRMNTATALSETNTAAERGFELADGEAMVTVAGHADRPFVIRSGYGSIRAEATEHLTVRRLGGGWTCVTCLDGTLSVTADRTVSLTAGQQVTYRREVLAVQTIDPRIVGAWAEGLLIFRDERLGTVVDELNRYRRGWIILTDSQRAEQRVTGIFHLDRPEELLSHIGRTLGLNETRLTDRLILLS